MIYIKSVDDFTICNWLSKKITGTNPGKSWCVRDATGYVMAVYNIETQQVILKEQHIYGSSRLGIYNRHVNMTNNKRIDKTQNFTLSADKQIHKIEIFYLFPLCGIHQSEDFYLFPLCGIQKNEKISFSQLSGI